MGKETGFLELDRQDRTYGPVDARLKNYKEFVVPLRAQTPEGSGLALHELRHAALPHRLPGQQHHPGLEPPGL